ncbi:hypothetical protein ACHAWF_017289 [Thalassiosira exigua]
MESADRTFAEMLQHQEDQKAMLRSTSGRALLLAQNVVSLVKTINSAFPGLKEHEIEAVTTDDMVWFGEQMLQLKKEFEDKNNIPAAVDIGYHYTHRSNLPCIRTHGLLTKGDRAKKKISSEKQNGSTFGDGIYTANNPSFFSAYGDTGLIVGRMQGKTLWVAKGLRSSTQVDAAINTIIGNKQRRQLDGNRWPIDDSNNEVVLRASKQCLPMIRYNATLLNGAAEGKEIIMNMQKSLEGILSEFVNNAKELDGTVKLSGFGNIISKNNHRMPSSSTLTPFSTSLGNPFDGKASATQKLPFGFGRKDPPETGGPPNPAPSRMTGPSLTKVKQANEGGDGINRAPTNQKKSAFGILATSKSSVTPLFLYTPNPAPIQFHSGVSEAFPKRRQRREKSRLRSSPAREKLHGNPLVAQKGYPQDGLKDTRSHEPSREPKPSQSATTKPSLSEKKDENNATANGLASAFDSAFSLNEGNNSFSAISLLHISLIPFWSTNVIRVMAMHGALHAALAVVFRPNSFPSQHTTPRLDQSAINTAKSTTSHDVKGADTTKSSDAQVQMSGSTPVAFPTRGPIRAQTSSELAKCSGGAGKCSQSGTTTGGYKNKGIVCAIAARSIENNNGPTATTYLKNGHTEASMKTPTASIPLPTVTLNASSMKAPTNCAVTTSFDRSSKKGGVSSLSKLIENGSSDNCPRRLSNKTPSTHTPVQSVTLKSSLTHVPVSGRVKANTSASYSYRAPSVISHGVPSSATHPPAESCNLDVCCAVCHEKLANDKCVALAVCKHVFHFDCIDKAFKVKSECPICRTHVGAPQGKSPSGTLVVSTIPVPCTGFNCRSIVMKYNMPSGMQLSYHEHPGQLFDGKRVHAYLPDNASGHMLLKRLIYAFKHGLIFTIGTSVTTGKENQCTWASVHHKTSLNGGVKKHGFPDSNYFSNCNSELDGLGVPPADALNHDGSEL